MTDSDENSSSELAKRILRLKQASFEATAKRERLPQPLFWSLFNSEIRRLQDEKKKKRAIQALLGIEI